MKTQRRLQFKRAAGWLAAAGFLLALAGDRAIAVTGADPGIDPLEILDLQVKPNVIIVFDSSGSMGENLNGSPSRGSGDFPTAKMKQGKDVLKAFITKNKSNANFLLGQYTQAQSELVGFTGPYGSPYTGSRFVYQTTNAVVSGTEVAVNGITSFSTLAPVTIVDGANDLLYFEETSVTNPTPGDIQARCTADVAAGTYNTTASFAAAVQTAMNGASCSPAKANTYTVTWNPPFRIARASGSRRFRLLHDRLGTNTPRSFAMLLGFEFLYTGNTPNYAGGTTSGNTTGSNLPNLIFRRATPPDTSGRYRSTSLEDDDGNPVTPKVNVNRYALFAARFWNGETVTVDAGGNVCSVTSGTGGDGSDADPFFVNVQLKASGCGGGNTGAPVKFTFAGGTFGGNSISCNGFQVSSPLRPCTDNFDITTASDVLYDYELPRDTTTRRPRGYNQDNANLGNGLSITSNPPPVGIRADGATPIGNSLISIKTLWGTSTSTGLWGAGQGTPAKAAIRDQDTPRERTIVMFVTDGNDTCASTSGPFGGSTNQALDSAYRAELLYTPIEAGVPESGLQTYVIGYGSGASTSFLNWIAWGGSGLGQGVTGQPNVANDGNQWTETAAQLDVKRAACTTCVDAFIAPDAETLAQALQSILDQGVSFGEFTAAQSVFDSVFELVAEIDNPITPVAGDKFDPDQPNGRYVGIVPNLFRSSFKLPGFKGQLKAFQNTEVSPGTFEVSLKWNAGQKLYDRVSTAIGSCNETSIGASANGQCRFSTLLTKVDRRIYTSSNNGVFGATVDELLNTGSWISTDGNRRNLWPPSPGFAPTADDTPGLLDAALGLPLANDAAAMTELVTKYSACLGSGSSAPANCHNGSGVYPTLTAPVTTPLRVIQVQRARREARETILANMAGGKLVLDSNLLPLRTTDAGRDVFYAAKDWMLADSTLSGSPAVIGPPIQPGPDLSGFEAEYDLMRDGPRDSTNVARLATLNGLGLRNPDQDKDYPSGNFNVNSDPDLKPAMTVLYVPANDMLHAFRAGPNCNGPGAYLSPNATDTYTGFPYTSCAEQGGEEMWGFVPFDQVGKLKDRLVTQTRANHTYMLAAGMRFADVFVPNPGTDANPVASTITRAWDGSKDYTLKGVWRRVLYFGRGPGGKYVTALDVTTAGPYTTLAKDALPPVPLWSRGNPDTDTGAVGGAPNNSTADRDLYKRMGQTWSVPTVSFISRTGNTTARKANGVDFVLHMGSGYGDTSGCPADPCEGQAIFTLDALTGDVIAAPQVGQRTPLPKGGHTEPESAYANAIVANVTAYNPNEFVPGTSPHPAASKATRVYVGDVHGRLWKVLTSQPSTPILFADFGPNQPIAAPVALLGLSPNIDGTGALEPYIYVVTGHDRRVDPALTGDSFVAAGLRDQQGDSDTTSPAVTGSCLPTVTAPCLWVQELKQVVDGFTQYYRGTVQPATAIIEDDANTPPDVLGRVFVGATTFNPPSTRFAPPGCPGDPFGRCGSQVSPCRSSFDSIVGGLGAKTGLAAFDLNDARPDDTFAYFDNSKVIGIAVIAAATAGGGDQKLVIDEGLNRPAGSGQAAGTEGMPSADELPAGGKAPTGTTASTISPSITTRAIRASSTVCQ